METDPLIEEVREVRRAISAEFGNDPQRLAEHYRALEHEMRRTGKFRFRGASSAKPEETLALHDKPSAGAK